VIVNIILHEASLMFIQILNELIPAQIGLKYYQTFTQTLCLSVWPGQKLMNRRELVISG